MTSLLVYNSTIVTADDRVEPYRRRGPNIAVAALHGVLNENDLELMSNFFKSFLMNIAFTFIGFGMHRFPDKLRCIQRCWS